MLKVYLLQVEECLESCEREKQRCLELEKEHDELKNTTTALQETLQSVRDNGNKQVKVFRQTII